MGEGENDCIVVCDEGWAVDSMEQRGKEPEG